MQPSDRPGAARRLRIVSTKFDGSPHYDYEGVLVGRDGPLLRLFVEAGTPFVGYRGPGRIVASYTALFWTDRHYNVFHNHWPMGSRGVTSYCNIGTPAALDGDTLRWVDLDLDVVALAGGRIVLDDEDEFAAHRVRFGYPEELVQRVLAARDEVLRLAALGQFPFDRESHIPNPASSGGSDGGHKGG